MKRKWMIMLMISMLLGFGVSGCSPQVDEDINAEADGNKGADVDTEADGDTQGDADLKEDADSKDEVTEPKLSANLYYPDDELLEMLQVPWYDEISEEQELYDAWEESAKLDTDTQVLGFDGTTLDLSNQFSIFINNFGTSGEVMYMEGLATTFKEYYNLTEIYITIEGGILDTGHSIYDFAL